MGRAPSLQELVPSSAEEVLDLGCHAGALLGTLRGERPDLRLSGVDIDEHALSQARVAVPEADLRAASADALPFDDGSFDVVLCMDVIEHLPEPIRRPALREVHRVLRPGGRLALQVPHAGPFAFLDPQNARHRFPRLYARLVGSGIRDDRYATSGQDVVWHEHFTVDGILDVIGSGFEVERLHRGGCLVQPLTEIGRWPYFRSGRGDARGYRVLQRLAIADHRIDWGRLAYEVLVVATRR